MLSDRQLADIEADVSAVLGSERGVSPNERLLARHARYLLDELNARKDEDAGRHNVEWLKRRDETA